MKRDFVFELREIKEAYNRNMPDKKEDIIKYTTGTVMIDGEEILVFVDDEQQPSGSFISKDSFFNKIINKIHEATNTRRK